MDYEDLFDESKMRPKNLMQYTLRNMTYRIAHNKVDPSHCGHCLHGSGCNRPGCGSHRNWKRKRKNQFRG